MRTSYGLILLLAFFGAAPALAARLTVQIDGVDEPIKTAVETGLELNQYRDRDATPAQIRRAYEHAEANAQSALEPYGYYHAKLNGELRNEGEAYTAVLHVAPGDAVTVTSVAIKLGESSADGQTPVQRALAAFAPAKGARLDHAQYEKSKALIQAALFASGFLDAELGEHRVEVSRATNTATITLVWNTGPRYRLGAAVFAGAQFPDDFLARYVTWNEGDFYSQGKLLEFQQRLIDADYFAVVDVRPDVDNAHDGVVPIKALLGPAKRTVYTGGLFLGTDTGPGVRGGIDRRWVNRRGHKLRFEAIVAERLKTLGATYTIPMPGKTNRSLNFGATYRDENTDTSQSKTLHLAANESELWRGWTRTIGLQFLTGDFKVANESGHTTLLYPEATLNRKQADDPTFVRRGYSLTVTTRAAQQGVLADTSLLQGVVDAKWIRGIGDNSRFIARGTLGASKVGDFDKLPPELRFFAGGDRSIRGYGYQTIGPRNQLDDVIGGEDIVVASAEYEYYFKPNWGIATFVDTGDAFTGSNFRLKIGTGVGARWRSPVGLVRVDLGVPVRDSHNSGVELHVTIGPDL